jgi:hypothetical protein
MSFTDGLRGFDVRRDGVSPRSIPYEKSATDTVPIKRGHPVIVASGQIIARASAASGFVSNLKILGFSVEDDALPTSELPSHFGQLPAINRPSGRKEVKVYPADQTHVFSAAIASGQILTNGVISQAWNIGYDSAIDQFFINTQSQSNAIALIIGIRPGSLGVAGGVVDFIVPAAKSSWQQGL